MNANEDQFDWRVLLIGGSSGVGKTLAVQELARGLSVPLLMADDIRLALQKVTTPAQLPDLHVFLNYRKQEWRYSEGILADWIKVGSVMSKPIMAIIANHINVSSSGPVIIEGDGILPSLLESDTLTEPICSQGLETSRLIRAIFIFEPDESKILQNLHVRGRGFENWDQKTQHAFAHASWLFGQWLVEKAQANNLPVLTARPHETLCRRIKAAI